MWRRTLIRPEPDMPVACQILEEEGPAGFAKGGLEMLVGL